MAKKQKLSAEEKQYIQRLESFQEHLPIADIKNRLYVTKTGEYVPIFEIGTKAIDLMSEDEKYDFAMQVNTTMETMALERIQFLSIPVPFDIEPYLKYQRAQEQKLRNEKLNIEERMYFAKEPTILKYCKDNIAQIDASLKYIKDQTYFIVQRLQSGNISIKKCYMIPVIKEAYKEVAVQEAADYIESKLKTLAYDSHRCSEDEMRNVLFSILNPLRKDVYRVPSTQYTPSLKGR